MSCIRGADRQVEAFAAPTVMGIRPTIKACDFSDKEVYANAAHNVVAMPVTENRNKIATLSVAQDLPEKNEAIKIAGWSLIIIPGIADGVRYKTGTCSYIGPIIATLDGELGKSEKTLIHGALCDNAEIFNAVGGPILNSKGEFVGVVSKVLSNEYKLREANGKRLLLFSAVTEKIIQERRQTGDRTALMKGFTGRQQFKQIQVLEADTIKPRDDNKGVKFKSMARIVTKSLDVEVVDDQVVSMRER